MQTAPNPEGSAEQLFYNSVPYPSYVFPQMGPDRLATLAILHGLDPARPSRCRYLELGCGDGTNTAAFASLYPDSVFVGIDLAENHIRRARETARSLDLHNVEFRAADILDLNLDSVGEFDFITAHGLFSWVPDVVRHRVLELIRRCLSPAGIGYLSYNALPGCYIRQIGWDLTKLRTRSVGGFHDKVREARRVTAFAAEATPGTFQNQIYSWLASEHEARNPENILHDDLFEFNKPFYFLEFAEMLVQNGLEFLCEANPTAIGDGRLSPEARSELDRISTNPLEREQYLDYLDFASFRQSLICRADASSPKLSADRLMRLHVQSGLRSNTTDPAALADDTVVAFDADGPSIETNHPLTKTFLSLIGSASPTPRGIDELFASSAERLNTRPVDIPDDDRGKLLDSLLQLYTGGVVRLFAEPPAIAGEIAEKPLVSPFARWQAATGLETFATPLGENIAIGNDVVRLLLILLDGTRDADALAAEIFSRTDSPLERAEETKRQIASVVDSNLRELLDLGVFVP